MYSVHGSTSCEVGSGSRCNQPNWFGAIAGVGNGMEVMMAMRAMRAMIAWHWLQVVRIWPRPPWPFGVPPASPILQRFLIAAVEGEWMHLVNRISGPDSRIPCITTTLATTYCNYPCLSDAVQVRQDHDCLSSGYHGGWSRIFLGLRR